MGDERFCQVVIDGKPLQLRRGLGLQALPQSGDVGLEFDCRKADCGICRVTITSGAENLEPPGPKEADYLKAMHAAPEERLACQLRVWQDLEVAIESVKAAAAPMPEQQPVSLTPRAVKQAQLLAAQNSEYTGMDLRLYLEGKGCDGFYYGVSFDDERDGDLRFESSGVVVQVDPQTYEFTAGSSIDWVDDERGQGFLVSNPAEDQFRGKFFKHSSWQQRLEALQSQETN